MAESNRIKKRVSCKRPHPNPLFEGWLETLYHDALKDNNRLAKRAKEALTSICKYPLPLRSGAECAILKGFDKSLCHYLDMHLNKVRQSDKSEQVAEAQQKREKEKTEAGKTDAQSSQSTAHQENNIESCEDDINPQPTRFIPSTSGIPSKLSKGTVEAVIKEPNISSSEELNGKHKNKYLEIKSDANSNTMIYNHNLTNIPINQDHPHPSTNTGDGLSMQCDLSASAKKKEPRKYYKPAYRTGGYAILVALVEQRSECPYREGLTKQELISKSQKHCDVSFTEPKPQTDYTAWIYAKRLKKKGLLRSEKPSKADEDVFLLTDLGRRVGEELLRKYTPDVTINDIIFHGQPHDRVPSIDEHIIIKPPPPTVVDEVESYNPVFINMPTKTFEIILLIDKHETAFMDKKRNPISALFGRCKHEFRSLKIGDFCWVARSKETGRELVLPYIVERKRIDDFGASIKDGRFHEQKFRLRRCGLKNVIYLIEKCSQKYLGLPYSTLMQAMVNTSVQEGIMIHTSGGVYESVNFICAVTKRLIEKYQGLDLRGCNKCTNGKELMTFDFYNLSASKTKPLTVRETFIKMLLQLKGLSVEKALAITNKYSTPKALMKAYDSCTEKEGELLLANLKFNNFSRNVGPAISKTIYMLFTKLEF